MLKCKVPLESSKDTREYKQEVDDQAQPYVHKELGAEEKKKDEEKKKERI